MTTHIGDYPIHPVADLFPMMTDDEYTALVEDIRIHGLREPISLFDNKVIDGRNRLKACIQLGITPRIDLYTGDTTAEGLVAFVCSANLVRRHLSSSQKAFIALEIKHIFAEEAKERQREAGEERANAGRNEDGTFTQLQELIPEAGNNAPTDKKAPMPQSRDLAAAAVGVNPRYVSDAERLVKQAPDLSQQVKDGTLTIPQAKKEQRKRDQRASVEQQHRDALVTLDQNRPWIVTDVQDVVACQSVITDPPYGILNQEWEPADLKTFTQDWLTRWNASGANFIVSFFAQDYIFDGKAWFDETLTNYHFQHLLIWHYANNKKPHNRQGFKKTWEPVYFYRRIGCDIPITIAQEQWGNGLNDFDCHVAATPQSNFNDVNTKEHPAQKPLSVMLWLVNALSSTGDLVCDPFCGSGTTGVACMKLSRRFHGIEMSPEYRILAEQRIVAYGK